ncbi:YceI family protein [Yimella sp. cx-51]|uniref:YceI family protein n=1 Tax=Yimella sp. cx-51 TaxID=2770551 RepID=UPI00165EA8CF|nr:YceI family protein [Yimella sp. cx-51]MBC9957849.1 YceI family protein [Yimella sp. cx-51]MBD2759563.1 YceI family protein [Yimella sp. cx-573]QTH37986.1 YceI family protein [Yimella sp. cx-51]
MSDLNKLNGTYVIDPSHSSIGFVARHAMVTKVRGVFNEFDGKATTGENLEGASIDVTIQVASVDTRNSDRDAHLHSADFFDAEKYPTITFKSTEVTGKGDSLQVIGDLTIKDVTKSVTIDFDYEGGATDPFGNERVGFEGKTVVKRADFGLTWNAALEAGGVLVSDKVTLEFDISAIKQA